MSKLLAENRFIDLSDYARPFGKWLANSLKNTPITPIHLTFLFGLTGFIVVLLILNNHFLLASFFILLKSGIDAADGELARIKKTPSFTGRFLDSLFDIILNFAFLFVIAFVSKTSFFIALISFICMQLQGTLYNYYYVILRNNSVGADKTSRIFESDSPFALGSEIQRTVDILFKIYNYLYGPFDKIIQFLDSNAHFSQSLPKWFMTIVSLYGLGFQLLIMAVLLTFNQINYVPIFFICYTVLIPLLILIRKSFLINKPCKT